MKIYTIGHSGCSAEDFFGRLRTATEAATLLDIRRNPRGHLSGFAKQEHLRWFTGQLTHLRYEWCPALAPSNFLLSEYRHWRNWGDFAARYSDELCSEGLNRFNPAILHEGVVLMCSEPQPNRCHRSIAAGHLKEFVSPDAAIVHL